MPPCGPGQKSARLPVPGLLDGIDVRPSSDRVETAEDGLSDEGFAFDELDGPVAALEKPEVSVASDVDESFDRAAVALIVHEDRRRHFIPVPRLVRVVLEVSFDLSGRDVDRDRRCDVEVVAGTLIAHPRSAVARSPIRDVRVGVVVAGHPYGRAAGLPLIALGPRLAARLTGSGHGERAP